MSSINANVTLTLAELDALRKQVKDAEQKVTDTKWEVDSWKAKHAKLEQEKMQVKVTLERDYDFITTDVNRIHIDPSQYDATRDTVVGVNQGYSDPYYRGYSNDYSGSYSSRSAISKREYVIVDRYTEVKRTGRATKIEYLNFSEVEAEFNLALEQKFQDKLTGLQNALSKSRTDNSVAESKAYEDLTNTRKGYEKALKELKGEHKADCETLTNIIKELQGQESEKTKDKLIQELKIEVLRLQNQSVWSKIFSVS